MIGKGNPGSALVIVDGMLDDEALSPPECMPNLVRMFHDRSHGFLANTPPGFAADSLACIATILGVPARLIPKGRAYAECAAAGVRVGERDMAFRCNIVRLRDGKIASTVCDELSGDSLEEAASALDGYLGFRIVHTGSYKYLMVGEGCADDYEGTLTFAPHEHPNESVESLLPRNGRVGRALGEFVRYSRRVLGENLGDDYLLLPWGESAASPMPSFESLHGFRSGLVCRTEIVAGIGALMDMRLVTPDRATADVDTDLEEKLKATLAALERDRSVVLHVNGADEASHRRDKAAKSAFLGAVDDVIIRALESRCDLLVVGDHATNPQTGVHVGCAQPFALSRPSRASMDFGIRPGLEAIEILTGE
jgi:2,3-bisphosphoglycerate-independent phosphoglycerate mutase